MNGPVSRRGCTVRRSGTIPHRLLAITLSLALAFGGSIGGVGVALAAPASAEASSSSGAAVRELTEERSENSKHFLLSDGTKRAEIHSGPIHVKAASGEWVDVDTSLVPREPGVFRSKAASVALSVRSGLKGAPVTIEAAGRSIQIDYLSGLERTPLVFGDTADYTNVTPGVDLLYESKPDGVKETLVLSSANVPATHVFKLTSPGLTVAPARGGGWGLFAKDTAEPVARIGALSVWDSSRDERGDPAYCATARMTVAPAEDGAEIAYEVDPAWLSDPGRVFPVYVDPTVSFGSAYDTYVWSATPGISYGASEEMMAGYYSNGHCRTLVKFDSSSIPAYSTVNSATVSLYSPAGSAAAYFSCARVIGVWGESSTWSPPGAYPGAPTFDAATAVRRYLVGTSMYQFISKDPARADGEESAYQYCGGDPVGKVDPAGLRTYRMAWWLKVVVSRIASWRGMEHRRSCHDSSGNMWYVWTYAG